MVLVEKVKAQFKDYWWSLLWKHFQDGGKISQIYDKLKELTKSGEVIKPSPDEVYKAFSILDYNKVLVCFVIGEPIIDYKYSPLFQKMSRMIENECFDGLNLNMESNMDYMLEQGVFTLPVVLTRSPNFNHNTLGWQEFTRAVIKRLDQSMNPIMFVYEDSCIEFMDHINTNYHKVIKLEEGCFKIINNHVKKEYNISLKW